MVDYTFYQSAYGGTLPKNTFLAGVSGAAEIILSLLYPRKAGDLDETETESLKMAVCAQVEAGMDKPVETESYGDWSARYAAGLVRVSGMPVSPVAVAHLRAAGLLRCWV